MRIEKKKGSRALVIGGRRYVPFLNDALTNFSTRRSRLLGPRAFLANSGRVWATALRPVPPKKGLVPYIPVRWGVHQIP